MTQSKPHTSSAVKADGRYFIGRLWRWLRESAGRRVILVGQIVVSVLFLAWLVRTLDQRTWGAIQDVGVASLVGVTLVFGTSQIFSGLRLGCLLTYAKPWRVAVVSTFVSFFWSNFLPGTIGGDIVRVARLKAAGVGLAHATGAIVVDRVLNSLGIAVLLLATSGGLVFAWAAGNAVVVGVFVGAATIGVLSGGLCLTLALKGKLPHVFKAFLDPLRHLASDWRLFLNVAFLTLCNVGASICAQYILSRLLGLDVSLLKLTSIICLVALATMLPISLNGIGVQEVSFVYLLTSVGAEQDKAILYSLLVRGIIFGTSLLAGIVAIADRMFPAIAPPITTEVPPDVRGAS